MTEVFTNEDEMFDRLVVVGPDAVYTANPDKNAAVAAAALIRNGAAVETTVRDAERIAYSAMTSVKANQHRTDLNIYHKQAGQSRMKNVQFALAETRDRAMLALQRNLPPAWQRTEVQYGMVRAVGIPLIVTLAIAAFTWLSVQAAAGIAAGEPVVIKGAQRANKRLFAIFLEFFGPTGVAIVGGLIVVGCLFWLIARARKPPLMVTLAPRS